MAKEKLNWHDEVVDEKGREAAKRIAEVIGDDFYLAGGTALALRFGHRISLDLDLFSRKRLLDEKDRNVLVTQLSESGPVKIRSQEKGTLHLQLGGTSVSFLSYPYKLLEPLSQEWMGIPVASVRDIAGMKLSAVSNRGARKDFIDLYFVSRTIRLASLLDIASVKFPEFLDFPMQACRALVYFDDAERDPMPRMLGRTTWKEIRAYFEDEIPKLARRLVAERPTRRQ